MSLVTLIQRAIGRLYKKIVDCTEALNQARAQSGRFSGAYW